MSTAKGPYEHQPSTQHCASTEVFTKMHLMNSDHSDCEFGMEPILHFHFYHSWKISARQINSISKEDSVGDWARYWSRTPKAASIPGSSFLHQLTRLCPENAHTGFSLAGKSSMCFSPVEISPLWWCLPWVHDLLSLPGTQSLRSLSLSFVCLHQPVRVKCAAKRAVEKWEICLQYEPQHIWGFKVSSHPSPTIQALSRSNTPSPSGSFLCAELKSATTALRVEG